MTQALQDNATKVEQTTYQKTLSQEELDIKREELADTCILLNAIDDEFKDMKEMFKKRTTPLKDANKQRLTEIKTKQVSLDGLLYHIPNYEDSMMEIYDGKGELVESRRLRPEEKQGRIPFLKAVGE